MNYQLNYVIAGERLTVAKLYKYKHNQPEKLNRGEFLVFKVKHDELLIQPNLQCLTFPNKSDFLCWAQKGAIYLDDIPNEHGEYSFYAFSEMMCVIYRQKEVELI